MPIKIDSYNTTPAIEYKYLHLQECAIRLATTTGAKTEIKAVFIPYGYDENGDKVFKPNGAITVVEEDFLSLAESQYAAGDPTHIQSFMTIEASLVKLLNDKKPKLVGQAEQVIPGANG